MALVRVIRRWHLREGMPIREIARRTGLSRNTIRKYLASKVLEPVYPARKSPIKLDEYDATLTVDLHRNLSHMQQEIAFQFDPLLIRHVQLFFVLQKNLMGQLIVQTPGQI